MGESIYAETFAERMDRARDELDPERHAYQGRYTVLPRCRVILERGKNAPYFKTGTGPCPI